MSEVILSRGLTVIVIWAPSVFLLLLYPQFVINPKGQRTLGDKMKVARLMSESCGVLPLCLTEWHSWQRKEQAQSRQRVKWPWDVNNLGDWGRPALINAGQQHWLSGIVAGAQSLDSTP